MISKKIGRTFVLACAVLGTTQFAGSCSYKVEVPAGVPAVQASPSPTPSPSPRPIATPLVKLDYKRDALLEKDLATIAEAARGRVGVAAIDLKSGEAAFLNPGEHFPMLSVYKLPIAMTVVEQISLGKHGLGETIAVTKDDFVRAGFRSPLRDRNPEGGEFTIRDLLHLSIVESDGTASDVLLRVAGGPAEVKSYLGRIGIRDMIVANPEKEIGRDWETQYANYSTPVATAELLRWLVTAADAWQPPAVDQEAMGYGILLQNMMQSVPGAKRIKGELPDSPPPAVAHKTGTGGTRRGVAAATHDVGIIYMPNGRVLVLAVFVSDSRADPRTREAVIAKIAKAIWDRFSK